MIRSYSNGIGSSSISSSGMGSSSTVITNTPVEPPKSSYSAAKRPSGTGMKLGSNKKDVNSFVDKLASEGVTVEEINPAANRKVAAAKTAAIPDMDKERYVCQTLMMKV